MFVNPKLILAVDALIKSDKLLLTNNGVAPLLAAVN